MHVAWMKNSNGKDKAKRIEEVSSYLNAFNDLAETLEKSFKKKEADRDYSPGWEQRQIAINEYNAALSDVLKLIDLNHKDH